MNWTGGTLQRTKHANKAVTQRQKAHFARARTHLQNGTKSPGVPFRPNYLQNDDSFELAGCLSSFGSGSVRHTGHSVRQRRDSGHRRGSSGGEVRDSGLGYQVNATFATLAVSSRIDPQVKPLFHGSREKRASKRKVVDTDLEVQLLLANKKRLLQQRDWIGMAPSKPVNLRRHPSEEKHRHGRRRKMEGQHGAISQRGEDAEPTSLRLQPMDDRYANAFIAGTFRNPLDPIRVRIGIDALTTACSTHADDLEQSQASSDPMLFDQQNADARPQNQQRAAQLTPFHVRQSDSTYASIRQATDLKHARSSSNLFRSHDSSARCQLGRKSFHKQELHPSETEHATPVPVEKRPSTQDIYPKIRITQRLEGNEHPLQLVFECSTSPIMNHRGKVSQQSGTCGSEHAVATNNTAIRPRTTMHIGNVPEPSLESEARAMNAIADGRPWALLFNTPDQSSSRSSLSNNSEMSEVHDHTTVHLHEVETTHWSQGATEGNQTQLSSSVLSGSLPALDRHTLLRFDAPAHALKTGLDRCNNASMQKHDSDEPVWHNFIFSSKEESLSEAKQLHGNDSEQRLWLGSSGYLPLSFAVSSINSTPFRPRSGHASREDVHDNAKPRLAAGSRIVNAPDAVFADYPEALSEHDETRLAARSATGEHSATHASILNNVSWDTSSMSSRMLSRAETSRRGLDHAQRATGIMSRQAQATSDEATRYFRHSPQYMSPGSFDEGLDLIDADAL